MTKRDLMALLHKHHTEIKAFGVKRYGVFGSFVRDEARENSDVDILVEFEPEQEKFLNFFNLAFRLEEIFGRKVDLITTGSLSPYIGPHILREVEYVGEGT